MQTVSKWLCCLIAPLLVAGLMIVGASAAAQQAHVTVTVTDKDARPITGAKVFLVRRDSDFFDIFTGNTDSAGIAHLGGTVRLGGLYVVDVYGSDTQPGHATLTINKFSGQTYEVSVEVARKPGARITTLEQAMAPELFGRLTDGSRMLYVHVLGRQPDGSSVPIQGATVFVPGEGEHATGPLGVADVNHNYVLGMQIAIVATAPGYETVEDSFTVGRGGTAFTSTHDTANITLTKISSNAATPMVVEFEVLDQDTDKPVAGARVLISHRTTSSSADTPSVRTDSHGKARIQLDPSNLTGTYTAKVDVEKYNSKWSEINQELLTPSDTPRNFTVYLKPKPSSSIERFAGTWEQPFHDGKAVIEITATGTGPTYANSTDLTNGKPSLERGRIWDGVVKGNDFVCKWESTYSDGDKSITRGGTLTCTLTGDKLIATGTVDPKTIKEVWHVGKYPSRATQGGTSTYTRAK